MSVAKIVKPLQKIVAKLEAEESKLDYVINRNNATQLRLGVENEAARVEKNRAIAVAIKIKELLG